tara:strand:+ start:261 stop:680 length:420 start_codon:yes stop_codon:yes gene_type:complete
MPKKSKQSPVEEECVYQDPELMWILCKRPYEGQWKLYWDKWVFELISNEINSYMGFEEHKTLDLEKFSKLAKIQNNKRMLAFTTLTIGHDCEENQIDFTRFEVGLLDIIKMHLDRSTQDLCSIYAENCYVAQYYRDEYY